MSVKSEAKKAKKQAAASAMHDNAGIDSQVLIAMWAMKRSPGALEFSHKAKSKLTVRMIGRVEEGITGEVTFELDKQQALHLCSGAVPLTVLNMVAERDLPFVEEPVVMLSIDSDNNLLPHVTVAESVV